MGALFVLSLCLIPCCQHLPEESLYDTLIFVTATQETPLDCMTLEDSKIYTCDPTVLYVLHTLQAAT